jgi:hypothetical protein
MVFASFTVDALSKYARVPLSNMSTIIKDSCEIVV